MPYFNIHLVEKSAGFGPLLLVVALAFFVPILLSRWRALPVVVGEILAGVIFGPLVLGWLTHSPTLDFLGDIGLTFLMFLAGLEIDLQSLFQPRVAEGNAPNPTVQAAKVYLLTLLLALPGGYLLNLMGLEANPILVFFVLSATSLGVLLPILKESDLLRHPYGQMLFLSATLADFLTVILFTIYVLTLDHGFSLEILSITLLFLVALAVMRFMPSFVRMEHVQGLIEELSSATVQIKVRGALAIMLAFVVLAEAVNAELILGAFLAGMIISLLRSKNDKELIHNLEAFGFGFFIPIFFILVGVNLNLSALFQELHLLLLLPVMLLLSLLVKGLPMVVLKKHFSWKELLGGGALLNTHLSLEVAVVVIGERIGLVSPATSAAVILFAVLTVILMPLIFQMLHPTPAPATPGYRLLIGTDPTAQQVARMLRAHGDEVGFLTNDASTAQALRQEGYIVHEGTPEAFDFSNNQNSIQSLLLLTPDDDRNLHIAQRAHDAGITNMLVCLDDPKNLRAFQTLGAQVYLPALQKVTLLTLMARNPSLLSLMSSTEDNRDVMEVLLRNRKLIDKPLHSLNLPNHCLLLSLDRDGEVFIPRGNTHLQYGDKLTLLGNLETLSALRPWLEGVQDTPTPTF